MAFFCFAGFPSRFACTRPLINSELSLAFPASASLSSAANNGRIILFAAKARRFSSLLACSSRVGHSSVTATGWRCWLFWTSNGGVLAVFPRAGWLHKQTNCVSNKFSHFRQKKLQRREDRARREDSLDPRFRPGKRWMDGCPPHRSGVRAAPLYAPSFQGASRRGRHSRDGKEIA